MLIGEMESSALFHVIDAKTTYKLFIGRPWLYEYDAVPSTYHQCFKYFHDRQVKMIVANDKSFTIAESHFANAKFYLEDDTTEEAQAIASPSRKEVKPHSKTSSIEFPTEEKKIKQTKTSIKKKKNHDSEVTKLAPVIHYVLITKRKEGQSPFLGDEESVLKDLQELTLPMPKLMEPTPTSQPLKEFIRTSQRPIVKHGTLPVKHTK